MTQQSIRQKNALSTAGLVLGILSVLGCWTLIGGFICGGLALTLSILSRGNGRLSGQAWAGIACGIIGLILSVVMMNVLFSNLNVQGYFTEVSQNGAAGSTVFAVTQMGGVLA